MATAQHPNDTPMVEIPLERSQELTAHAQHLLDVYKALGVEWGHDPFPVIEQLRAAGVPVAGELLETEGAQGFDSWAIVELFGHKKLAGRVTEQTVGGCAFVRLDVPATKRYAAYTKLLGNGAIYAITPVDEELARKALLHIDADPIPVYIPPERRLGAGDATAHHDDDDDLDDEDDDRPF